MAWPAVSTGSVNPPTPPLIIAEPVLKSQKPAANPISMQPSLSV